MKVTPSLPAGPLPVYGFQSSSSFCSCIVNFLGYILRKAFLSLCELSVN